MPITASLSGTLLDATNNQIVGGTVTITLTNYGNNVPYVSGSGTIVGPVLTVKSIAAGAWTATVIGNDQITPAGTIYSLIFADANGRFVGSGAYKFLSLNTYNLNATAPNVTYPVPAAITLVNANQIQGSNINRRTPLDAQVLTYIAANGDWEATTPVASANAVQLQGINVKSGTPLDTQVLTYVAGSLDWEAVTPASAVSSVFARTGAVVAAAGDYTWNLAGNAAAGLTLANAGFASTFNQTSAVPWTWANTTVATVGTTNASPTQSLTANYWNGAASATDSWTIGSTLAAGTNGKGTLTFTHTGSTGIAAVVVPQINLAGSASSWYHGFNLPSDIYSFSPGSGDAFSFKSNGGLFQGASGSLIGWTNSAGNLDSAANPDAVLFRSSAGVVGIGGASATTPANLISPSANGASWLYGQASELLTLSTVGLTTDTTANLLPAGAIIDSVVCRITTSLTTTTNWAVGDANIASRFSSANATLAAGTTSIGLNQVDLTGTSGQIQNAAAKVRITCTGANPGAGIIRITVFYRQFAAPTS